MNEVEKLKDLAGFVAFCREFNRGEWRVEPDGEVLLVYACEEDISDYVVSRTDAGFERLVAKEMMRRRNRNG